MCPRQDVKKYLRDVRLDNQSFLLIYIKQSIFSTRLVNILCNNFSIIK